MNTETITIKDHMNPDRDRTNEKLWKRNLNDLRETFIERYIRSGFIPKYMITRNYYYHVHDIDKVEEDNDRVNKVLGDLFNQRGIIDYEIGIDHFIERHKDKIVRKVGQEDEWIVKRGSFHVHTLLCNIDDKVVTRPNRKIRKILKKIYGKDGISENMIKTRWGLNHIKKILINYSLRDRCGFIGNSVNSLDIQDSSDYSSYDGYTGWKGMVSYVTKDMYSIDRIDEVFDFKNNKTLRGLKTKI